MPVLLLTKKPKAPFHLQLKRKTKEGGESQEERDVEIERASEKNQEIFGGDFVEKLPVNLLFNCQEWTRPFRYVKNNQVEGGVKSETSEYFFVTCESDGKLRISFANKEELFNKIIKRWKDPQKKIKNSIKEMSRKEIKDNIQKIKDNYKPYIIDGDEPYSTKEEEEKNKNTWVYDPYTINLIITGIGLLEIVIWEDSNLIVYKVLSVSHFLYFSYRCYKVYFRRG